MQAFQDNCVIVVNFCRLCFLITVLWDSHDERRLHKTNDSFCIYFQMHECFIQLNHYDACGSVGTRYQTYEIISPEIFHLFFFCKVIYQVHFTLLSKETSDTLQYSELSADFKAIIIIQTEATVDSLSSFDF